jgi:hypothetical protein
MMTSIGESFRFGLWVAAAGEAGIGGVVPDRMFGSTSRLNLHAPVVETE